MSLALPHYIIRLQNTLLINNTLLKSIHVSFNEWRFIEFSLIRSSASSPEPDNNNQDYAPQKTKGLDPRFLPDPGCPVDLRFALMFSILMYYLGKGYHFRLSPTISQVDEDGAGRPAR